MNVGERVEVLVLVKHLVSVFLVVTVAVVHQNDLALALFVDLLQFLVLAALVLNGLNQFTLHSWMAGQVAHSTVVNFVTVLVAFLEFVVSAILV